MKKIKIQTGDYVLMDDDIYTNFSNYEWNLSSDYNIRASVGCFEFMLSRIVMNCTHSFTFSFEAIDKKATKAICDFFFGQANISVEENEECGTFIYCEV